ncbi:MAG: F0F1 ATP synthase subunit epsilon [Deltaproteobacteria bacterium]|nr:F0F1 ATP synthase subunit epsilon [Deltaproteobacteria bacterium]
MGKLYLEVVTPNKVLVSREVDSVVAPGTEGQFGVLPGHVPFLSGIIPGEIRYSVGTDQFLLAVTRGFAEISNDNVSVLVDAAEKAGDIDVERARLAMERARERLSKDRSSEDIDFVRAEAALQRATVRIKVAEKAS